MFNAKTKSNGTGNGTHRLEPAPVASKPVSVPTAEPAAATANVIGKGTIIDGNITTDGELVVEGTVRGDVSTKTRLITGPQSLIEGNLSAEQAEIAGRVKGTVQARGLLTIKSSGVIEGDVITKNLNVESGSPFNGRLQVGTGMDSTQAS